MAIVKVNSDRCTIDDPLYQWDQNQDLYIYGLSLTSVPAIHFTNDMMDRAIVRSAQMDATGVITAPVPNSLLQKPYTIKAFVCVHKGNTFETLYKIEIPVKARPKPGDYAFEDEAGEIYSYNAIEAKATEAVQAATDAKANYNAAINALTVAATTYETAKSETDIANNLFNEAMEHSNEAQERYEAALETLGGIEDGTVYAKRSGDTMLGVLDMGGYAVTGLPEPTNETDAVNKAYADTMIGRFELVWEHSNPITTATMPTRTVEMDLSKYDMVLIRYVETLNSNPNAATFVEGIHSVGLPGYQRISTVDENISYRQCRISATGIEFETGYYGAVGKTLAESGAILVPFAVYGIKIRQEVSA